VLVIGDSFVEFGEEDSLTLSEQLKEISGLTTFNLGRGWYGPFQYLELLKQYGSTIRPQYAVLCFFDGNDAEDTKQFLRWQKGKSYYSFVLSTKSYVGRYFTAFRDTYKYLFDRVTHWVGSVISYSPSIVHKNKGEGGEAAFGIHSDLGRINIGGEPVPMRFIYWNRMVPPEELLKTEEWMAIRQVLKDYEHLAAQLGILPIVVFVPTKLEVYGSQYVKESGERFLEKIESQLQFEDASHDALSKLMNDTKLRFVDLLPEFRKVAKEGDLLYYPFDTHWNAKGRQVAAKLIAEALVK
jgi:hypothetical protein